jgi:hypothetical protein
MECPEDLFEEAKLMSIEYSTLRSGFSKWRSFKYKSDRYPENEISLQKISEDKYFLIYSKSRSIIQGLLYSSVEKRLSIKQSRLLFFAIRRLWEILNPFHLSAISKKVYHRLLTFIYFNYLNCTSEASHSEEYAFEDTEIDFRGQSALGYVEFYEGVFECVDYFTKSYLVSEYARFVNNLTDKLVTSFWFNGLDLHSRIHIDQEKPLFAPWMTGFLKVPKKNTNLLNQQKVKVSQRLLLKPEHIIDKKQNVILEKRINKLSRMQSVPIKYIVLNRTAQTAEKSKRSRPSTREKPQAKRTLKFRRHSHILEDVIEGRKSRNLSQTQEIFIPLC